MLKVLRAAAFSGPPERKNGRRARTSSGNGCGLVSRCFVSSLVARSKSVRGGRDCSSSRGSGVSWSDLTVVSGRAQAVAAVGALAIALASGVKELPGSWRWLSGQRDQFEHLTAQERAQEPGTAQLLPVDAFDFFRSKLRERDRFYLAVRKGNFTAGVDRATAARIFGRFYLLPAILVDAPADADVVLTVGIDPRSLGVSLGPVAKFSGGNYFAARVRQ
jgi:hypothetical protein